MKKYFLLYLVLLTALISFAVQPPIEKKETLLEMRCE